jgi:hypothetical protein
MSTMARRSRWEMAARLMLAVIGGYLLANYSMACLALSLILAFDMHRGEAVILASLLAFPLFLTAIIWAVGAPRLTRVGAVFAGVILASFVLAQWLSRFGPAAAAVGGQ